MKQVAGFVMTRSCWLGLSAILTLAGSVHAQEDQPVDHQAQIAGLEKNIAAKEKEIRELRRQVIGLRRQMEASQRVSTRYFTNSVDLVEDMPPSAFPKAGPEFTMERTEARKWFEKNLTGKNLQLFAVVYDVLVEGEGPYNVTLYSRSNNIYYLPKNGKSMQFDRVILFEGAQCAMMLSGIPGESFLSFSALDKDGAWIARYDNCTTEEMEQLRQMKGREVNFKGKILHTRFQEKDVAEETMGVFISVSPLAVDDFLPKNTKRDMAKVEAQFSLQNKD